MPEKKSENKPEKKIPDSPQRQDAQEAVREAQDGHSPERRRQWQDRRSGCDRRNPERLRLISYDCRTGLPRRKADRAGELADGDIWWRK